jgi:hypothetical protein
MTPSGANYGRWLFAEVLEHLDPEKHIPRVVVFAGDHVWVTRAPIRH